MEMDKETKELLNQAIQMGVFQNHRFILTQITNALGEEYEIDKQALREVVEIYRKKLKFEAWYPVIFVVALLILILLGLLEFRWWTLAFIFTVVAPAIYTIYLNSKLNYNLSKVLKPKSRRSA